LMAKATTPVTSLKALKSEVDSLKKNTTPVDSKMLLRLLDYVESREKLTKELLIHMNAVEGHLVRVTELLQKMPQINIGLLADSLQAMIPKLDEIAYNTRKMVDYLEVAAEIEEPKQVKKAKPQTKEKKKGKEEEEGDGEGGPKEQLEKIEEQNKALIDALGNLSSSLDKMGSE
jgi:hypothetical protein